MYLDVAQLEKFYRSTRLGAIARSVLRSEVQALWPEARNQTVLGYGFATPLLRPYLKQTRRVIALMPGQQGVVRWPPERENVSVLCEETNWPIETGKIDRILMMHGLEGSERVSLLLEEAMRVLGPGGKLLVIVPNRAGLWCRSDHTPFGHGRPYSASQLDALLDAEGFKTARYSGALWRPPSERRFWRKSGALWDRIGMRLPAHIASGVLIVEAIKRAGQATAIERSSEKRRPAMEAGQSLAREAK